jgi:hypothetical protein
MAVEDPRANLLIAIVTLRVSRLLLKFSFSRNNDYRDNHKIYSRKTIIVWSLFFPEKRREMIIPINPT